MAASKCLETTSGMILNWWQLKFEWRPYQMKSNFRTLENHVKTCFDWASFNFLFKDCWAVCNFIYCVTDKLFLTRSRRPVLSYKFSVHFSEVTINLSEVDDLALLASRHGAALVKLVSPSCISGISVSQFWNCLSLDEMINFFFSSKKQLFSKSKKQLFSKSNLHYPNLSPLLGLGFRV